MIPRVPRSSIPFNRTKAGSTMQKKIALICATLMAALVLLGAGRPAAEVGVHVPFDFMVGQHMFPAGYYRVRPAGAKAVRIESARGINAVMMATDETVHISRRPLRLLFDKSSRPPQLVGVYGEYQIVRQLAASPSKSLTVVTTKPGAVLASDRDVPY